MNARATRQVAYLSVFATGAAAMTYEVAWQRYLARLLGSDAAGTAVVLAAFLGGLSLGYHAFGKAASRTKRPWRAYALAEAGIGAWGLAFPFLFSMVEAASSGLALSSPWSLAVQGLALAALLMGPPAVLMGATIPLLTQSMSPDAASAGRVHALVYGVNTAGAFAGAVMAGYLLVPGLGLPGTLAAAASLNLSAAAWFALASPPARAAGGPSPPPPSRPGSGGPGAGNASGVQDLLGGSGAPASGEASALQAPVVPALGGALMALAFLSGFTTMALENVLVRFVAVSVGGSAYAFTMVVGVFVLAIAAGALAASRARGDPGRALWANQAWLAASLVLLYPTLDTWPYLAHRLRILFAPETAGFVGFQASAFALLLLAAGPPAACLGAGVPLLFNRLRGDLSRVGALSGRILCVNTLGNLAGSLCAGVALHPALHNGQIFLLCVALALAGAFLAAGGMPRMTRAATGLAALAALVLLPGAPLYDPGRFMIGTFRLREPLPCSHDPPATFYASFLGQAKALFLEDGPEGSAAVVQGPRLPWSPHAPMAVFVNGKSDSSTVADMATLRLLAHIPALLAPSRERVLVVGLGTGVTSAEFTLYPDAAAIDTAEISSSVIRALPLFAPFTRSAHLDPRMRVLHADAFRVLAVSDRRWDIIVSEPSNPWVLGVDALFSREFHGLARERLAPGGLFVQWIHFHDASPDIVGTVLSTLGARFPHVRAFMSQANDLILVASAEPLADQALTRAGRLLVDNPGVAASLGEAGIPSLEALLAREIPLPPLAGPVESLDRPRLHYAAGLSLFRGDRVPSRLLLAGKWGEGDSGPLLERLARRGNGAFGQDLAASVLGSAVDRRGEEPVALPLAPSLEERLRGLAR